MSDIDEAPAVMAMEERGAWAQVIATSVTTIAYAIVIVPRALRGPIADVSWVTPMIVTIAVSIVAVVVGSIVAGVSGAALLTIRGRDVTSELGKDHRDLLIANNGRLRAFWVYSLLSFGALVLAMIDADTFWIGHWVYATATVGTLIEAATKIRSYRRGLIA